MIDIQINPDLLSLVEDKRVAIIGPAPYLKGRRMGSMFDNYDIIVRPNNFHIDKSLVKDYGSRTDVMFHNFGGAFMTGLKKLIENHPEDFKKLKMMGCLALKNYGADPHLSWDDDYVSGVVENFNHINANNTPFYWIGVKDYKKIYNKIGEEPNTGILALTVLSSYPLKEIFVSGFTFYKGKSNRYEDIYYEGAVPIEDVKQNTSQLFMGHGEAANRRQLEYTQSLAAAYPTILKGDDVFASLMGETCDASFS
jgi:hypothetical protein